MIRRLQASALVIAASCFSLVASPAIASNTINVVMKALAGDITNYLVNHNQKHVAVDSFDAPANAGSNMQIERRLRDHLASNENIDLIKESELVRSECWSIRGSYSVRVRGDQSFAEVTARIYDEDNVEQHSFVPFPFKIDEVSDLTIISAATFDASHASDKKDKQKLVSKALHQAIEKPNVVIALDGRVSATSSSPYSIELLICSQPSSTPSKSEYKVDANRVKKREFKMADGTRGFAIANLHAGELYAVRLYNNSDHDAAVKLSIDGLSSFEFTQIASYRKRDVWIVPRKSSGTVYGWHRTNDLSESFEVSHLPDSAIGKSGRSTAKAGTIQAIFYQAWSENDSPPEGELVRGGSAFEVLATKRGEDVRTTHKEIRRHASSTPVSSICVRYAKPIDDLPPSIGAP